MMTSKIVSGAHAQLPAQCNPDGVKRLLSCYGLCLKNMRHAAAGLGSVHVSWKIIARGRKKRSPDKKKKRRSPAGFVSFEKKIHDDERSHDLSERKLSRLNSGEAGVWHVQSVVVQVAVTFEESFERANSASRLLNS